MRNQKAWVRLHILSDPFSRGNLYKAIDISKPTPSHTLLYRVFSEGWIGEYNEDMAGIVTLINLLSPPLTFCSKNPSPLSVYE